MKYQFQVIAQEDLSLTDDETQQECNDLRAVMESYDACCEYPEFVFADNLNEECNRKCRKVKGVLAIEVDICCYRECYVVPLGILKVVKDKNGNILESDLDWHAIAKIFMSSVGNDTMWEPIINNVVLRCYNQFGVSVTDYDCEFFTTAYSDMIYCTVKQIYLQCPKWNLEGLENCKHTYEYVSKCSM